MRIERLSHYVRQLGLEALLIDRPVDLFYLTDLTLSLGRLVVEPNTATLFVDGRYFETAKHKAPCSVELSSLEGLTRCLQGKRKIGIDSAFLTVDLFDKLKEQLGDREWLSIANPLKKFRAVKEESEIRRLKEAARVTYAGYLAIVDLLKEGISEKELAFEFELFCRKKGASSLSFPPIIAFGENSAYPHHRAAETKLKNNQIVLIDVGAVVEEYRGDMTRTLFFGEPDPKLYSCFLAVQRAQEKVLAAVRPKIAFGELDRIARQSLENAGLGALFTHGLSHGIGLETHEYPSLGIKGGDRDLILEPNMVFTIEPGVYLPGLGGIRIENTVRVTEKGVDNFYD